MLIWYDYCLKWKSFLVRLTCWKIRTRGNSGMKLLKFQTVKIWGLAFNYVPFFLCSLCLVKLQNNIYLHNGVSFQCDHHSCSNKFVLFEIHLLLSFLQIKNSGASESIPIIWPLKKNMLDWMHSINAWNSKTDARFEVSTFFIYKWFVVNHMVSILAR